jgi:hypothetical protein
VHGRHAQRAGCAAVELLGGLGHRGNRRFPFPFPDPDPPLMPEDRLRADVEALRAATR